MSILSQFQSDPVGTLIMLCYRIPAVLIALTLHEVAHGYMARRCGDNTAEMMGRLSLNPTRHLDLFGTVCMFLFGIGWAKPVPVNPRNFKNFRRDEFLVSIAGIAVNFALFLGATLMMILLNQLIYSKELWSLGGIVSQSDFLRADGINFGFVYGGEKFIAVSAAKNGSYYGAYYENMTEFLRLPWLNYVQRFFMNFSLINLSLALFNLLPVPPLDGSHILNDIILRGRLRLSARTVQIISIAFMAMLFLTDWVSSLLGTAIYTLQGGVVDVLLRLFGMA